MKQLSKAQKRVLWHMVNGWELRDFPLNQRLQKEGKVDIRVSWATIRVLWHYNELIAKIEGTDEYALTFEGAELAKTITEAQL